MVNVLGGYRSLGGLTVVALLYVLSTANSLYGGRYRLRERFQTHGQHAFIYDLAAAAARLGIRLDIALDDPYSFPLTEPLRRHTTVLSVHIPRGTGLRSNGGEIPTGTDHDMAASTFPNADMSAYDAFLVDVGPDDGLPQFPDNKFAVAVVHNPFQALSPAVCRRANQYLTLNTYSAREIARRIPREKIFVCWQGIDLRRLTPWPTTEYSTLDGNELRVLVSSRLDMEKGTMVGEVINRLAADRSVDLTVLGDGSAFWPLSDRWGHRATFVNFVPSHSMHRFVPKFDVIVSSGRGVMEALACGKGAVGVGRAYLGDVTQDNILALREVNFSGLPGADIGDAETVVDDVHAAAAQSPTLLRGLAEKYFDAELFVRTMVRKVQECTHLSHARERNEK